jgi:phosphatidyl-myo-inositol dimannoside synthase
MTRSAARALLLIDHPAQYFARGLQALGREAGVDVRVLSHELARADLYVLATRTRGGPASFGEEFGLVLLEAQVPVTPVFGSVYGGSRGACLDRVTGIAPVDELAGDLAKVLDQLLWDRARLADMGRRAAEWARECFPPKHYALQTVARLL